MIKARLEAKKLRIWLICITIFFGGVVACAPLLGLLSEDMLCSALPFLDFTDVAQKFPFADKLPAVIHDNLSFILSLVCVFAAFALVMHIIYVIVLNKYRLQRSKAAKTLRRSGYSAEYYELIEKKRQKLSSGALSSTNDLCAAKEYCDGRRYESALEILRSINIDDFDLKDATRYYALYSYVFILTGDFKNARFALDLGEPFMEKQKGSAEGDLSKALLMYAEHDFAGAKSGFKDLVKSKNAEVRVWAGMYLALIYLREHKKEKARKLAVSLSSTKKTPRQSEDMLKLLKKIEQAYALEAAEASSEANATA